MLDALLCFLCIAIGVGIGITILHQIDGGAMLFAADKLVRPE
jgi:hypothetical protein